MLPWTLKSRRDGEKKKTTGKSLNFQPRKKEGILQHKLSQPPRLDKQRRGEKKMCPTLVGVILSLSLFVRTHYAFGTLDVRRLAFCLRWTMVTNYVA